MGESLGWCSYLSTPRPKREVPPSFRQEPTNARRDIRSFDRLLPEPQQKSAEEECGDGGREWARLLKTGSHTALGSRAATRCCRPAIPPGTRALIVPSSVTNEIVLLTMDRVPSITRPTNPAATKIRPRLRAKNFKNPPHAHGGGDVNRFCLASKVLQGFSRASRFSTLPLGRN